jgi:hypothetical protein
MKDLEKIIGDLATWMESENLQSYDPYDLESTKFVMTLSGILPGKIVRAGLIPLKKFPSLYHPFVTRTKAATSSALYASTCFMMGWNEKAEKELGWLENHACKGYSGYCWGLPFDWRMGNSVVARQGTPYSTIIIYMTDAFLAGYEITGNQKYLSIAESTADFFMTDLKRTYEDQERICLSYSPLDNFQIINVNSYSAANLYTIFKLTHNDKYRMLADKLINYILAEQNNDGSWYYWSKNHLKNKSIDSLHQCYIMENLYRCYLINHDPEIIKSIERAFDHFVKNYYDAGKISKNPMDKHYAELIDAAESIILFNLLKKRNHLEETLSTTIERFSMKGKPYFYSAISDNKKDKIPYIRWGQSQLLYALADHVSKSHYPNLS